MTGGYVVNDGPDAGPATPTHPGAGQGAAVDWLNRLRALAQRVCVAPTTYAQADLDALHRVGDSGLSSIATNGAGDIVDQILGIASARGASLIGDGPLTGPAVQLLSAAGARPSRSARPISRRDRQSDGGSDTAEPDPADLTPVRYSPDVVATPFDPAVGAALAGAGTDPVSPSYLDSSLDVPAAARLGSRAPPGRAGRADVAGVATTHRAAHRDPHAADGVEPAARGRAGDPHRGGHHDSMPDWRGPVR